MIGKLCALLMGSLALLTACGTTGYKSFVASGESLKAVGTQFETVAKMYKQGCDAKQLKMAECDAFRAFGLRFKAVYPISVDLWDASRQAGDGTMEKQTRERIIQLSTELSQLAVTAYAAFGRTQ
jgi:hypothetical protein